MRREDLEATTIPDPALNKAYLKVWQQEERARIISLEYSVRGHPRMAKQMAIYLPGKATKQIRDKRREPS
jgi:hypothetical protein